MTKYRIRYIPLRRAYQVQQKAGILGWVTEANSSVHGVDIDYEFRTQQDALDYIEELQKPRPSNEPVVVWEGER